MDRQEIERNAVRSRHGRPPHVQESHEHTALHANFREAYACS